MDSCLNPLINTVGAWVGEVAHIHAAEDDGPRADPALTPEERRHPNNLILMCKNCHSTIDELEESYPAEMLKEMKARHESRFEAGLKVAVLTDCADEFKVVLPESLSIWGDEPATREFDDSMEILKAFTSNLSMVPVETRRFLANSLTRSTRAQDGWRRVLIEELKRSLKLDGVLMDDSLIANQIEILQKYNLAYPDLEDDKFTGVVFLGDDDYIIDTAIKISSTPESDSPRPDIMALEEIIVRLDFTRFE